MRVAELKALVRERGLRGYSWLRKAELIALLRPAPSTRPAVPGELLAVRRGPHEWRPPTPNRSLQPLLHGGTLLHLCKHKPNRLGLYQID